MVEYTICPECGHKTATYSNRMNQNIARSLVKLYKLKKPMVLSEMDLTHNQICNFQKLQFWGFVRNIKNSQWIVTEAGERFCKGEPCRERAIVRKGVTIRLEGDMVDIYGLDPMYQKIDEFVCNGQLSFA